MTTINDDGSKRTIVIESEEVTVQDTTTGQDFITIDRDYDLTNRNATYTR